MAIRPLNPVPPPKSVVSRRKERYNSDVDYREKSQAGPRKAYRVKNGVELENCLRSLTFYVTLARNTRVISKTTGVQKNLPVLTLQDTAQCLSKIYQTVWRWITNGMIPEPEFVVEPSATGYGLYHVDEVRILIEEIGNHERSMKYYRRSHNEVRTRIFDRITKLRLQLNKR